MSDTRVSSSSNTPPALTSQKSKNVAPEMELNSSVKQLLSNKPELEVTPILVYQFKITLKGVKPPIWRRIQIPSNYNFHEFHLVVNRAMGWNNVHLHQFVFKGFRTSIFVGEPSVNSLYPDETIDEKRVKISEYFRLPKDRGSYEYDFGDSWEHDIVLEKILPLMQGADYPKCIKGKRACPPEDCGGVYGYLHMLQVLANPEHEKHKENKSWLEMIGRGNFNAEEFNINDISFA